jgi:tetratricopeptide (TPR) repeat protein
MKNFTARDVATMIGLSPARIRSLASSGIVQPSSGEKGELLFSFHDLVLLRAAKELGEARIPLRTIRRSLERLRDQLPAGAPISGVRIAADGSQIIVRDGRTTWKPESGQVLFDFAVSEIEARIAPFANRKARHSESPDEWYERGFAAEEHSLEEAEKAYRRAIELDPSHADALVNLGRVLHERNDPAGAEQHYRQALQVEPRHAVAHFNFGVLLEDQGRAIEALGAYERAIEADPEFADAHYNLAGIYEELGRRTEAFRHLKTYRQLVES